MNAKTLFDILGITLIIGLIGGGFYFLFITIQNENNQTNAEIQSLSAAAANGAGGNGLGAILGGVASVLSVL